MDYQLDLGLWNQVFAVPSALVDRHLKLAGKEQLQVILWVLRHAGEPFSPAVLAEALGMPEDSARDAVDYWKERGFLAEKGQAPQTLQTPPAQPQEEPARLPPRQRLPKPDAVYLAERIQRSEAVRYLFDEAQSILGVLSPAMSAVLLAAYDDYGLPVEVLVMLLHYVRSVGKAKTAYVDQVARDWAQSGITTPQAADEKLRELDEKRRAWGRVSAAAGLNRRAPTKREEEFAYRWVFEWKFSDEMLTAAYERCAEHTGKFSLAYLDKIFSRWHKEGVQTLEDLAREEEQKQAQAAGKKTYDLDELERLSFFDLPEEL